jgi:hypothetical protein
MTPTERASPKNGIWLCENCATVIDKAADAFSVDTLRSWKSYAETQAVKASRSTEDVLGDLIGDLARLETEISDFVTPWYRNEPAHDFADPQNSRQRSLTYYKERSGAYRRDIAPKVTNAIVRAEAILGPESPLIIEAKDEAKRAATNYHTMWRMADTIERLRTMLELQ